MSNNKYQFKGTPGPWYVSPKIKDSVISLTNTPTDSDFKHYGGEFICESAKSNDALLIAAAPDLLEACINMVVMLHDTDPRTEEMRIAIHKALNIGAEA